MKTYLVSSVSLSLSHWYPGSGVFLIVSIPDLCTLTYFAVLIGTLKAVIGGCSLNLSARESIF